MIRNGKANNFVEPLNVIGKKVPQGHSNILFMHMHKNMRHFFTNFAKAKAYVNANIYQSPLDSFWSLKVHM
jgi:hypothetical protein